MTPTSPPSTARQRLVAAAALLALAAALLAACGGQNGSESAAPATPPSDAAAAPQQSDPAPQAAPQPEPEPSSPAPPESAPEPADPPEPELSAPQTATSDDNNVTVEVPEGALADSGVVVSVRTLGPDERPAALAGLELRGALYELEPDGAVFEEPVKVTRYIDLEQLVLDPDRGLPVPTLLTVDGDGSWDVLDEQTVSYDGSTAIVSGTTTHFSTLVSLAGLAFVDVSMTDVTREVSKGWKTKIDLYSPEAFGDTLEIVDITTLGGTVGTLDLGATNIVRPTRANARFTCSEPGEDAFFVELTISGIDGLVAPVTGADSDASTGTVSVTRSGLARCTEPVVEPPEPIEDPPPPTEGAPGAEPTGRRWLRRNGQQRCYRRQARLSDRRRTLHGHQE